jgi:serine/threonine protein phosphatase 1
MKTRTFVIGDIHGGLKALKQVVDKIDLLKDDTFIFLGDLVDGWSESAQTIQHLINFSSEHNCVFIKGNHDLLCKDWLVKGEVSDLWIKHGGAETMESYQLVDKETRRKHILFFEKMKGYYIDSENRLFVHAGFTSMYGPEKEFHKSNLSWDRTLWETVVAMDVEMTEDSVFYPKRLKLFKEIYIGHTPTTNIGSYLPINKANVWNLDTAAAFKGKLSMMNIDTKEVRQSDFVYELYPDETGRN